MLCLKFDSFIYTDTVLDYAQSQSNKTVQHAIMREFSKHSPKSMQIRILNVIVEKSCEAQINCYKEQVW